MKPINISKNTKELILEKFLAELAILKNTETMTFNYKLEEKPAPIKPHIRITLLAYFKISALVKACDKEIAWHGTVTREDDFNFTISDILCYPQKVTGATVNSVDEKYDKFLMELSDEQINTLRFQGHSHVNMPAFASGVDLSNWEDFLEALSKDDYYIFCVTNKVGIINFYIYDLKTNAVYPPSDITYSIIQSVENPINLTCWGAEAIKEYIEYPYTAPATTHGVYTHDGEVYDRVMNKWVPKENVVTGAIQSVQNIVAAISPEVKSTVVLGGKTPTHSQNGQHIVEYYEDVNLYICTEFFRGSTFNKSYAAWTKPGPKSANKNKKQNRVKELDTIEGVEHH